MLYLQYLQTVTQWWMIKMLFVYIPKLLIYKYFFVFVYKPIKTTSASWAVDLNDQDSISR